jgi:hypothetical protein
LLLLLAWLAVGVWNAAKPMPPGTRVASLPMRLAESDLEFLAASPRHEILDRALTAIGRAEQLIVVDQSPLPRELAQALLLRKHVRPHLKIIVVTDPAHEAFGGTPPQDLQSLERVGVVVARVRLDRLRDSNPAYTGLWRILVGWWSNPFEQAGAAVSLPAWSRQFNYKADQRQVMVSDDGAGGWFSMLGTSGSFMLDVRGGFAHDILASELKIAAWSTDDDRLPAAPPIVGRGVGTIDARFLTEGAIGTALLDGLAAAGSGDEIYILAHDLSDRAVMHSLLRAGERGAHLQLLLDPIPSPNLATAGELAQQDNRRIEVRWNAAAAAGPGSQLAMVRHRNDLWLYLGSANLTRRNLADLNLESAVELRLPASSALARSIAEQFSKHWSGAAAYAQYSDPSDAAYWRYRLAEASGLSSF